MAEIIRFETQDVRFPTSATLDGSDAMNPFPDYSAAYLTVGTSDGEAGHSLVFTVGRGNDVQTAAIQALSSFVLGRASDEVLSDLGAFGRSLSGDSQLRWLGPEKGVIHMAVGAVLNALWDLRCLRAGKPLWRMLADLEPEELVSLVDFRYLRDALTPDQAFDILATARVGRAAREAELLRSGYPAYTTTPGWLGYDDEKLAQLSKAAVAEGFSMIKLKVGGDLEDDVRRLSIAREAVGPSVPIAVDANQVWGVDDAIAWLERLAPFAPYWVEEPTSPDEILGHARIREAIRPIRVATGEHVQNPVVFKQLLQAGAVDVVQIDACRVGGVNDNVAILLLAAKFGVPVCPHAGGVGLCEMVQHLSMFDLLAVSGSWHGRMIEYVDHLHQHFTNPVVIHDGRYVAPVVPGAGARMLPGSLARFGYPDGPVWAGAPITSSTDASPR